MSSVKEPVLMQDDKVIKSNRLISALTNCDLLENKILVLAIQNLTEEPDGSLVASMPVKEVLGTMGLDNKAYYRRVDIAAKRIQGQLICIADEEHERFVNYNLTNNSRYDKGVLTIEFNAKLRNVLVGLLNNYTKLSVSIMMSFTSIYSFRLYEYIRSKCYNFAKAIEKTEKWEIRINIWHLRVLIGLIDVNDQNVDRYLEKRNPNYEAAFFATRKPKYPEYTKFKSCVLEPAVKEINEKSDLTITFSEKKVKNGKVNDICFRAEFKKTEKRETIEKKLTISQMKTIVQIRELVKEQIPDEDIRAIASAAEYDFSLIQDVYEMAESASQIRNLTGWLIDGVKRGYEVQPSCPENI